MWSGGVHGGGEMHMHVGERRLPERFKVEQLERAFYIEWQKRKRRRKGNGRLVEMDEEKRRRMRMKRKKKKRRWNEPWDDDDEYMHETGGQEVEEEEKRKENIETSDVNLGHVLIAAAWRPLMLCFVFSVTRQTTLVSAPLVINVLVTELERTNPDMSKVFVFVFVFLLLQLVGGICFRMNAYRYEHEQYTYTHAVRKSAL